MLPGGQDPDSWRPETRRRDACHWLRIVLAGSSSELSARRRRAPTALCVLLRSGGPVARSGAVGTARSQASHPRYPGLPAQLQARSSSGTMGRRFRGSSHAIDRPHRRMTVQENHRTHRLQLALHLAEAISRSDGSGTSVPAGSFIRLSNSTARHPARGHLCGACQGRPDSKVDDPIVK